MQALKIVVVTYNVYRNEKIPDLIWTEPGLILAQISGHRYKVRCLLGMQEMNLYFLEDYNDCTCTLENDGASPFKCDYTDLQLRSNTYS